MLAILTWSLSDILIGLVVLAAVLALTKLALDYYGLPFPPIVWQVICIVGVTLLIIIAIRFVLTM